jgi:type III pantothenate kinase
VAEDANAPILLVDAGNSALKWALFDGERRLSEPGYLRYAEAGLDVLLTQNWSELPLPVAVWLGSVAPRAIPDGIAAWSQSQWRRQVRTVCAEAEAFGLRNGYREPDKLGVDRWLALLGAATRCSAPYCVVDCGTAITVDAVDSSGVHLGGFILPGLAMGRSALLSGTDIRSVGTVHAVGDFGSDTAEAIDLGARRSVAGLVEYTVSRLAADGHAVTVVLTGSARRDIAELLPFAAIDAPLLVLEGLARYAERGS